MAVTYRKANLTEALTIQKIIRKNSKCFGFVMMQVIEDSIKKGEVIVAEIEGVIVGFVRYSVLKTKHLTRIHEICTLQEHRGGGIAVTFLSFLPKPIIADCPYDNESNRWYQRHNFYLNRTRTGTKRPLNEWIYV